MACALFFASCSDEYMENMNTDPSKAATIDPNAQLTTAQLQTYGDLSMMEIYRNYHYAFTQQLMGCWNTTNYGGIVQESGTPDEIFNHPQNPRTQ